MTNQERYEMFVATEREEQVRQEIEECRLKNELYENALKIEAENNEFERRVTDIKHRFTSALISIGINPEGMDLLEVIADLADALNRTMCELRDLEVEFHDFKYNVVKENNK